MTEVLHYLETGSRDPAWNLAFEEYMLNSRTDGTWLLLWQNDRSVIVGLNQNTAAEINREFVEEHQIRVVRRITGGGAVYHDLGNLNYSFLTDSNLAGTLSREQFTRPVTETLQCLGLNAEVSGRNDILVEGRKVSGTAEAIRGGRILHHGTLLFDSDPAMLSGALNASPEKYRSKGLASVRSRVGNIRSFLPRDMTLLEFWDCLKTGLAREGLVPATVSAEDLREILRLKETKYGTWEWNYGRSPRFDFTGRRHWPGGDLEVQAAVSRGRITEIRFPGDYMALTANTPLTDALRGCTFERDAVSEILNQFPLDLFFGSISREQILETMFHG